MMLTHSHSCIRDCFGIVSIVSGLFRDCFGIVYNVTNGTRDEDPQERIRRVIAEVFVISRVGDDFDDSFIRVSELY